MRSRRINLSWLIHAITLLLVSGYSPGAGAIEISGNIGMDASVSMPNETTFLVTVRNATSHAIAGSQQLTFSAGSTSANTQAFSFTGLNNAQNEGWDLRFICLGAITPVGCADVVSSGVYSTDPDAIGNTHYNSALIDILATASDHTGLTLTVLPGRAITGSISTPGGDAAGNQIESEIAARAQSVSKAFSANTYIQNGNSSAPFKITVPDPASFPGETYKLEYSCRNPPFVACAPYVQTGYYNSSSSSNSSANNGDADVFNSGSIFSGINFELLPARQFSGTVTLPNPAPAGGVSIQALVQDTNVMSGPSFAAIAFIAEGNTSANYLIAVPNDSTALWSIRFSCQELVTPTGCADYIDILYYQSSAANNVVYAANQAQTFGNGAITSGLNITLIEPPAISGTLVLSQGIAPEGGLRFVLTVNDPDAVPSLTFNQIVTLTAGQSEVDFTVAITPAPNNSWRLSYNCIEAVTPLCSKVTDNAFLDADSGDTVAVAGSAALFTGGVDHSDQVFVVPSMLPDTDTSCFPIPAGSKFAIVCL